MKTEYQKLRESMPISDAELRIHLTLMQIPFELDTDGVPWISHAALMQVKNALPRL